MKHLLLLLLLPAICHAQGDQSIIKVPVDDYGTKASAILHLPDDYKNGSTRYPLMVFLHGIGEGGKNPASIYNSATAGGPAYFIAKKKFPASFINPADGKSYKFIVLSPQNSDGWSTSAPQLDYILTDLYKKYRVDTSRVYLTGLSAGGEGIMEYSSRLLWAGIPYNTRHQIAAVIPMSAVMNALFRLPTAKAIVANNVRIWGFGSPGDTHGDNTLELITYIDRLKSGYGQETRYKGGHCCWGQFYDPSFKQNGMSIYEWALQYKKGAVSPEANTPAGFAIPGKIEAESYAKMSGIQTQPTTDAGGGRNVGWLNPGDWMDYPVSVATAGTYTVNFRIATPYSNVHFQLRSSTGAVLATLSPGPSGGPQLWKTVSAVISLPAGYQTLRLYAAAGNWWNINWMQFTSGATGQPIPGKIEAKSYIDMSGIHTQDADDNDGEALNVGWIDWGDWMDYAVNVAAAGKYTVKFRVATPYNGARFQLRAADGTVLTTVSLDRTGGFQSWKTVSAVVTLPAGYQTLRLYSVSLLQWNINQMQFAKASQNQASQSLARGVISGENNGQLSFDTTGVIAQTDAAFALYPNPVSHECRLQLTNEYTGDMIVRVLDMSGAVRQNYKFNKSQSSILVNLPLTNLPTGTWFVSVRIGSWSETKKIIKL